MSLDELFEQFIRERVCLRNISSKARRRWSARPSLTGRHLRRPLAGVARMKDLTQAVRESGAVSVRGASLVQNNGGHC
jgi:hypothetical protein